MKQFIKCIDECILRAYLNEKDSAGQFHFSDNGSEKNFNNVLKNYGFLSKIRLYNLS